MSSSPFSILMEIRGVEHSLFGNPRFTEWAKFYNVTSITISLISFSMVLPRFRGS